jgi:hypothetical protein
MKPRGPKKASHDPKADPSEQAPPLLFKEDVNVADEFIDHPTDAWVRANLPDELRTTAYQLPADCADIAVILRHVWLFAHNRTETYKGWTVGVDAGKSRTTEERVKGIRTLIKGEVFSGNVKNVVNAYSDPGDPDKPLRSWAKLQKLLHAGDILVWQHPDGGGHTQTIVDVVRDKSGNITRLTVVSGTEPIFAPQAEEILKHRTLSVTAEELRKAPGRRIETRDLTKHTHKYTLQDKTIEESKDKKKETIWTANDGTTLVVAGPPASAIRSSKSKGTEQTLGTLSDWLPALKTKKNLEGTFEAALQATRAMIEGDQVIDPTEAESLGSIAGKQLWSLAMPTHDPAVARSHFERLQQMRNILKQLSSGRKAVQKNLTETFTRIDDAFNRAALGTLSDWLPVLKANKDLEGTFETVLQATRAMIEGGQVIDPTEAESLGSIAGEQLWSLAKSTHDPAASRSHFVRLQKMRTMIKNLSSGKNLKETFTHIDDAFNRAARGATTLDFSRKAGTGTRVVKILLIGFDPSDVNLAPRRGEWSPSGAAVLELDRTTMHVGKGIEVAVEGVILPVNFDELKGNIVERIIQEPQAQKADAILTLSVDPSLTTNQPVRIERFAVGVHLIREKSKDVLKAIPSAGSTSRSASTIIETQAPIEQIAIDTASPKKPTIVQPTIGDNITFRFGSSKEATQAATLLGVPTNPKKGRELTINDVSVLRQIIQTMKLQPNGIDIKFAAGKKTFKKTFQATVVEGSGGNLAPNEVSFRIQRLLGGMQGSHAVSFHVRTQAGSSLPEDTSSAAAQQALEDAKKVHDTLIATLQHMIPAVANQVVKPSNVQKGTTP